MVNDIAVSIAGEPIKNGSLVVSSTVTGSYSTNNVYVKNTPDIGAIEAKYDNRFYNGIFVELTGNQTVVGG